MGISTLQVIRLQLSTQAGGGKKAQPAKPSARRPSQRKDGKDFKGLRHLQETEPTAFQRGIVLYAGRALRSPNGINQFDTMLAMNLAHNPW